MSDETKNQGHTLGVLLFPGFELLDVFGPLEALGNVRMLGGDAWEIVLVAEQAGPVASAQGPKALAEAGLRDGRRLDMLLVPGGIGTREGVDDARLTGWIAERAADARYVTSVCTGAAMLARAGVLDGRRATTNKAVFGWVESQGPRVQWVRAARWVEDGKFFTSSGVSAGMDMALRLVALGSGQEMAENVATAMEYDWHRDAAWDPFAKVWGLA